MNFLFGHRKTPEEQLRETKRVITKTIREIEREKQGLENEKRNLTNEIKQKANLGQIESVRILARQLIRTDNYIKKLTLMRSNFMSVSMKVQTLKSTASIAGSMKQLALTMRKMNTTMKLPELQKIMMEFEKQSDIMNMKDEMMSDTIDDILEDVDDPEESENVVNSVLEELGIELNTKLNNLPSTKGTIGSHADAVPNRRPVATNSPAADANAESSDAIDENDLERRLARLKKG